MKMEVLLDYRRIFDQRKSRIGGGEGGGERFVIRFNKSLNGALDRFCQLTALSILILILPSIDILRSIFHLRKKETTTLKHLLQNFVIVENERWSGRRAALSE